MYYYIKRTGEMVGAEARVQRIVYSYAYAERTSTKVLKFDRIGVNL